MKVNGKRISIDKFWGDFKAPVIENIEELYEEHAVPFINQNIYCEDAWCYVQDYEDGILIRFFLMRKTSKLRQKDNKKYYEYGDLCCNREVKQTFLSKDGFITHRVNGYYFRCFEGLKFTNYYDVWHIRKKADNPNGYYTVTLDIAFSDIVYGKFENIKYIASVLEDKCIRINSNKDTYILESEYETLISRYLANNLYEITYKMGEFCELPKVKNLTPKILINACKYKVVDKLDIMFECNSLDYEAFSKISCYYFKEIKNKLKDNTNYKETFPKFIDFMIKYTKHREKFDSATYNDYLQNLLDLNIELNEKNLLNKDFVKDHTRMYARIQEVKNKVDFDRYKRFVNKNNMFKAFNFISDKKYSVIIPTKIEQYIAEAEQNNNCVYKNGYWKKMANKKCFILFVRKNEDVERSYLTVELSMDYKVVQCYANHNSVPDNEGKTFVNNLALLYKERNLFKDLKGA